MPLSPYSPRHWYRSGCNDGTRSEIDSSASPRPGSAARCFSLGFLASLEKAYEFLNSMMDAYAAGRTVHLVQSYSDQAFLVNGSEAKGPGYAVAFTYDNAVAIQAHLASGAGGDLARAEVIGNGLIEAQATNFPFNDGRFAQAYYVNVADQNGA